MDYGKKICCGKANEKERRLYSREQTRRCSLRLCYRRRGDTGTNPNDAFIIHLRDITEKKERESAPLIKV